MEVPKDQEKKKLERNIKIEDRYTERKKLRKTKNYRKKTKIQIKFG